MAGKKCARALNLSIFKNWPEPVLFGQKDRTNGKRLNLNTRRHNVIRTPILPQDLRDGVVDISDNSSNTCVSTDLYHFNNLIKYLLQSPNLNFSPSCGSITTTHINLPPS